MRIAIALASAAVFVGCDEPPTPRPEPKPPASAAASAKAAPAKSAAPRPDRVELQKFRVTTNVTNREPVDALEAAGAGKRVYAHATLRNRTGGERRVSLVFKVDGEERTTVDLKVDASWSYRTWGYVTLRPGDEKATLKIELRDDKGELLAERSLPIEAQPKTK